MLLLPRYTRPQSDRAFEFALLAEVTVKGDTSTDKALTERRRREATLQACCYLRYVGRKGANGSGCARGSNSHCSALKIQTEELGAVLDQRAVVRRRTVASGRT